MFGQYIIIIAASTSCSEYLILLQQLKVTSITSFQKMVCKLPGSLSGQGRFLNGGGGQKHQRRSKEDGEAPMIDIGGAILVVHTLVGRACDICSHVQPCTYLVLLGHVRKPLNLSSLRSL